MDTFDPSYSLKLPIKILKLMGFHQEKDSSWYYRIYGIVTHLIGIEIYLLMQIVYLCKVADNVESFSDCLSVMFTYVALLLKSFIFMYKLQDIKQLIVMLEHVIVKGKFMKQQEFSSRVKQVYSYFKLYWTFGLISCSMGALIPIYYRNEHKIAYKMWVPFNYEDNFYGFVAISIYQTIFPLWTCGIIASLDMLPIMIINIITGLLEELIKRLKQIGNVTNNERNELNELLNCIELHQDLKQLAHKTEEIFTIMIFTQGFNSCFIMCTTAFVLSLVSHLWCFVNK